MLMSLELLTQKLEPTMLLDKIALLPSLSAVYSVAGQDIACFATTDNLPYLLYHDAGYNLSNFSPLLRMTQLALLIHIELLNSGLIQRLKNTWLL